MLSGRGQQTYYKEGSVTVTVSGESISHNVDSGLTARAGVRVNSDGTIDKLEGVTYTQIDSSTDWRIPNGSGIGYYVQFTKGVLDPNPTVGTLNSWLQITTNREVYYEESDFNQSNGGTITIEISATTGGGSPILDSGDYPLDASVGIPA